MLILTQGTQEDHLVVWVLPDPLGSCVFHIIFPSGEVKSDTEDSNFRLQYESK